MDLFITITSPHLEHPSTREHIPQRWDRGHKYWTIKANDHHSISNLLSLSLSLSHPSLPSFANPLPTQASPTLFFFFFLSAPLSLSLSTFTNPSPTQSLSFIDPSLKLPTQTTSCRRCPSLFAVIGFFFNVFSYGFGGCGGGSGG